jgi:hypothetical protein
MLTISSIPKIIRVLSHILRSRVFYFHIETCHGSEIPFRLLIDFCGFGRSGRPIPRVPLMLGDAPSLPEHLESNLENNQLGKYSLTVRPRVTAYYRDRFARVPIPFLSPIIPFVYRDR